MLFALILYGFSLLLLSDNENILTCVPNHHHYHSHYHYCFDASQRLYSGLWERTCHAILTQRMKMFRSTRFVYRILSYAAFKCCHSHWLSISIITSSAHISKHNHHTDAQSLHPHYSFPLQPQMEAILTALNKAHWIPRICIGESGAELQTTLSSNG